MKWLAIVVLVGLTRPVSAHPLDMGYLRVDAVPGAVSVELELDISHVATALRLDVNDVTAATVDARAFAIAGAMYRLEPIRGCVWGTATAQLNRRSVVIRDHATCPGEPQQLSWSLPFVNHLSPTFQLLVSARAFDNDVITIIDKVTPVLDLSGANDTATVSLPGFIWKGVEHIGAAPSQWRGPDGFKLPDGIDHILFLLGLLLAGGSMLRLIGVASGFTVGHTITLGLAGFGIVRPPSSLIEPLIALTIAFVAVEAWSGRFERHRWKIATCFGLVHGFGFANALTELHLSRHAMIEALFGYNLGVELGQIAIVLVIAPLVLFAHRDPRLRAYVVQGAAAAIFVAGMYWFFARLFG
ncbi:MAG TPA: HupE/UreJ family protein [Kofleriaceae bacterium]|nr:HupE/UreJ family protein [Kofleriaceae bacterium]